MRKQVNRLIRSSRHGDGSIIVRIGLAFGALVAQPRRVIRGAKWTSRCLFIVFAIPGLTCCFSQFGTAATIRIEDTQLTLVGEWVTEVNSFSSGGSTVYANYSRHDPGAYAFCEFDGTGVRWIGTRSYNGGLFRWIVDEGTPDERAGNVNTYIEGVDRSATQLLTGTLVPKHHTLKFISLGIYGLSMVAGVPSETYLDAFDITTVPEPSIIILAGLMLAALALTRHTTDRCVPR